MFTDRVTIEFRAGKGGNGVVAWRREKYIPKGGPCGGNGGKGGSIIFEADLQIPSLESYRNHRLIKADNGQQGGPNNRIGKNGPDLVLKVPCGTLIKDADTNEILFDFTKDKETWTLCLGGRGGKGNNHFKSPTNRAPSTCTPGKEGETRYVELELKLIADIGLVGLPNAGKSTLISALTDIRVKIAPYPFTTLRPNLGYHISEDGQRVLFADIPGIIEGAHDNRGLGLEFLRHVERTHLLLFVVDLSAEDPLHDFAILRKEIELYNPELLDKPHAIALNKIDAVDETAVKAFKKKYKKNVFEISALTGQGLEEMTDFLKRKLIK